MMGRRFHMLSIADDVRQIQCPKCGAAAGHKCSGEKSCMERAEAYFAGVLEPLVKHQAELRKPVESVGVERKESANG